MSDSIPSEASPATSDSIPGAAFREALAHFASGVTIVAARRSTGPIGFTATGFTSVSLSPPLILVCVNKTASAYDGVVGAELFGVSVLGEDQRWIAEQFARSGVDRFAGVPVLEGPVAAAPLIGGALAHLECRPHARHDAGDHTLLLGHVLSAWTTAERPLRPLLHFARRFGAFA
jgi:3-hydroxy-9,10-secoandrosta-1,3,5(10)-triene-9,17-dione monooxygenase reductase component